jgi:PAS domain S-box-containing protein
MVDDHDWQIVLLDDEADILEVLTINLEDAGYKVATAANGEAGLELCRALKPQIVITDLRMPKMGGLEVLAALKAEFPEMEVIVATAYGEMNLAIQALQLDASDFITKPINDEALHLALRRARQRYTSRRALQDYAALLEKENAETTQELLKNLDFQRKLIDGSMDAILGCDETDLVVTCNQSLEAMTGYAKAESLHKMKFADFFPPAEETRLKQELAADRFGGPGRLFLYEANLLSRDGHHIPVQVSAITIKEGLLPAGLVCFFRDLRDLRRLEREMADQAGILHQDKMMSLGRLAASVAHEINNPLAGILNYARLMQRILGRGALAGEQQDKFQRYLNLVESETDRCSQIISSLLTFSRRSTPEFKAIKVDELLKRSAILSRHKMELQNIRLVFDLAENLPTINGDFNQLQQCLINLIFNAMDAMPDGGTVTLAARCLPREKAVTVSVSDTGTGIAPEDLPHIFEPFFTTKKEGYGVGLGLSTVYGIMERHQGQVLVDSRPGRGTLFTLRFPAPGQ